MTLSMQQVLPSAEARGCENQSFAPLFRGMHAFGFEAASLITEWVKMTSSLGLFCV
jgi:hypothetical protein